MKRRARPIAELPFDKVLAQAQALADLLAPFDLGLNMKERNRRLKMPSSRADAVVPLVGLAKDYGLGAYAAPIDENRTALAKLAQLQLVLTGIQTVTSGLFMSAESETWRATTTVYTMLRRLARADGDLARHLQPVVARYFARKKAAPEKSPAATPTPAAVPSATKKARRRG
jgi:hypothetical protein